jgi:hypothetical protein
MTPARKAALQWFHDRGEVRGYDLWKCDDAPSGMMVKRMQDDGQLQRISGKGFSLTDKGRRMLHGDDK